MGVVSLGTTASNRGGSGLAILWELALHFRTEASRIGQSKDGEGVA